jgi:tetratricopeptide (TPR) repeat protein
MLGMLGQQEEGLAILRKAAMLDPLSSQTQRFLGLRCAIYGRYDEAEEALRKSLDLNPKAGLVYTFLSVVRLFKGHYEDALAIARQEVLPDFRLLGEILANHSLGNAAEADRLLGDYTGKHGEYAAYQIAECYGWRGDKDRAFEWLERAYRQRDPGLGHTATDQLFKSLHDDPRWLPFVKKMGLA